jgi:lipid II:glycine glycyltransferase (peptidoglycan interpeptide bridge formation enzyme)
MSPTPGGPDRWQAWDTLLQATPDTGFMQSSWWAEFRTTAGFEHFGIMLKDGPDILGGAVVLKFTYADDHCFYYVPEGPVLPADEAVAAAVFEKVLEAIEDRRRTEQQTVSHLRIEPRWQRLPGFVSGFRPVPPFSDVFFEPRNTLCIDLRASEEAILAQMKPKGRYNIRVARRHGVSVVEDASDRGLADFQSIYEETAARQGMEAKPADYFQALLSLLSSRRHGSMFFAQYHGTRVAAAVVVYFGRRATYFFGGSLDRHREVMAPYLLHFEIMRAAKALGHEWYDLWGTAPEDEPDHPWHDISVFKRKFGGVPLDLVPTLDYVYDAAAYGHYLAAEAEPAAAGPSDASILATVPNPPTA